MPAWHAAAVYAWAGSHCLLQGRATGDQGVTVDTIATLSRESQGCWLGRCAVLCCAVMCCAVLVVVL